MIGGLSHDEYHPFFHLLREPWHSLNTDVPSLEGLPCFAIEKTLLLPYLKRVYKTFSKVSCDFSSCLITRFIFSLAESKTGCLKIGSMFDSNLFLGTLKINMEKTPEKVTKDPKRVEVACKGREKYMNKLKESIVNDVKKGSRDTTIASNETNSVNNTTTTRSNYTYVYGIAILSVLVVGVVYFLHITLSLKIKSLLIKSKINHQNNVL